MTPSNPLPPAPPRRNPVGAFTLRYTLGVALVGCLALLQYLLQEDRIASSYSDNPSINVTGRQRMLTTRIALLSSQLVLDNQEGEASDCQAKLGQAVDQMRATHQELTRGDPGRMSGQVRALYFENPARLDARVQDYLAHAAALVRAPKEDAIPGNLHFDHVRSHSERLEAGLDAVVACYQREGSAHLDRLLRSARIGLAALLGGLGGLCLFVFVPMCKRIRREQQQLQQANEDLDRRVAERTAALERQHGLLRSIMDNVAEGVIVCDETGRMTQFNPPAKHILGLAATDKPSTEWPDHYGVYLSDRSTPCPHDRLPLMRALQGEVVESEDLFVHNPLRAEGIWVDCAARPLPDASGGPRGAVVSFRDITHRKQTEQALRDSEALYSSLVENLPVSLFHKDLEGKFVFANRLFCATLNKPLEAIVGKTDCDFYAPELAGEYGAADRFVLHSGRPWGGIEEHHASDGLKRYVEVLKAPVRNAQGEVAGLLGIFWDVTARKQAEEEVRQVNWDLDRRVQERTAELVEANRELEERNGENEMFVYSVSHDLRSPLVNLEGFSKELELLCREVRGLFAEGEVPEALRQRGQTLVDKGIAECLDFIRAAVRRLSGIIDALLRLSRVGRIEYRWEPVDMTALVRTVVDGMQATIQQREARVTVLPLPEAWGDRGALEQVFANLIGNALKYLDPERPGVIEVGGSPSHGNPPEGTSSYYVKDNGLGIHAAHQGKVFRAFQRVHQERAEGEGMGLAIVARVVGRHRGRVWVESQPGQGSRFWLTLPTPPSGQTVSKAEE